MTTPRLQLADELLRRFSASLRSAQLYSKGHPIIGRNLEQLSAAIQILHTLSPTTVIGLVGDEIIVDDLPIARAEALGPIPVAGFFCAGEIGPVGGRNFLHTFTASAALFPG